MPTLGKLIAQPMADIQAPKLSFNQKVDRWMINDGSRRMYSFGIAGQSTNWQIRHRIYSSPCHGLRIRLHELQYEGQLDASTGNLWNHISYRQSRSVNTSRRRSSDPITYVNLHRMF